MRKASHRNHFLAEELHLVIQKYGPVSVSYEYDRKSRDLQKQFKELMSKVEDVKLQLQKLPLNDHSAVKNLMIHQKRGYLPIKAINHYVNLSFTEYEYLGITKFEKTIEKSATSDIERKTSFAPLLSLT